MLRYLLYSFSLYIVFFPKPVLSQSNSSSQFPKQEYRAAWMATVINLDWPQSGSLPVRYQKEDLLNKIVQLKETGINVIYFQIRTEGDALYDSEYEPWSKYLTGKEGKAPDPYWDPLAFAIEEAHKRGMQLHAWLNPYRAMRSIPSDFTQKQVNPKIQNETLEWSELIRQSLIPTLEREFDTRFTAKEIQGTSERDTLHVSNKHPEWLLVLNNAIAIFDPGLPEVMEYTTNVVMDVVNRYDVDGIHFDDYFYPYPPNHMGSSTVNNALDDSTFIKYPRGFSNKSDWRRNNVDLLVEMIYDSIQVVKPWVKFGISPFGIWKNGTPSGITGLNAYETIYGDGLAWLDAGTIDYIVPQLYWPFGGGQDYAKLANWWSDQAVQKGRHMYAGHGVYRADVNTFSGSLFKANEVPRQIRHNRANSKISGSVFFRTKNLVNYPTQGFSDSLKTTLYKHPALPPTMAWKDTVRASTPGNLKVQRDPENEFIFELSWDDPVSKTIQTSNSGKVDSVLKYSIYRIDSPDKPDPDLAVQRAENVIAITGQTSYTDIAPPSEYSYWYFVTSAQRNNVESLPSEPIEAGMVVSNESAVYEPLLFSLEQNFPNPFNPTTTIEFSVSKPGMVTLQVFDLYGRETAVLLNGQTSSGSHRITFDASTLSSGIYFYRIQTQSGSMVKKMILLK